MLQSYMAGTQLIEIHASPIVNFWSPHPCRSQKKLKKTSVVSRTRFHSEKILRQERMGFPIPIADTASAHYLATVPSMVRVRKKELQESNSATDPRGYSTPRGRRFLFFDLVLFGVDVDAGSYALRNKGHCLFLGSFKFGTSRASSWCGVAANRRRCRGPAATRC